MSIDLSAEAQNVDIFYTVDNTLPNQYSPKYKDAIAFPAGADMLRVVTYRDGKAIGRLISIKTDDLAKRVKK